MQDPQYANPRRLADILPGLFLVAIAIMGIIVATAQIVLWVTR